MTRRLLLLSLAAIVLTGIGWKAMTARAQIPADKNVQTFMRAKLGHAQSVLEGLTVEDYEMISKNANQMALLSQEAQWHVFQTPKYRQHSSEFRQSVEKLKTAADEKRLDGATLAYIQVTMRCVECHKYVRSVRVAQNDLPRVGDIPEIGRP